LGDYFYVVHEGEFDIYLNQPNGAKPKQVATFGEGTSFGELALMYHAPRAATVMANRPSKLWAVDRITYRRILTAASRAKHVEYESFFSEN
jgi:cAMP-dependent protein kinase regulator